MKLTVLGCYGPYPIKGGSCSGYLIEEDQSKILLDCGNGVFSNYQKNFSLEDLDAIILSHLHPDHISDIFILRYALEFRKKSIKIFAPNNPHEEFIRLFHKSYEISIIDSKKSFKIGNMMIHFEKMNHVVPDYAICIEANGKKLVYSGDTSYTQKLIDFSKNADFLLCEAGVLEKDLVNTPPHLSPEQAVEIGERANAKRIMLTHFYPEYSLKMYKEEIGKKEIEYAKEMKTVII